MKHKFIDMHCDTISELYRKKLEGKPYSLYENDLDIDIKRLGAGGAYIQCFAMFTYLMKVDSAYEHANALTDLYYEELEKNKEYIAPLLCRGDRHAHAVEGDGVAALVHDLHVFHFYHVLQFLPLSESGKRKDSGTPLRICCCSGNRDTV